MTYNEHIERLLKGHKIFETRVDDHMKAKASPRKAGHTWDSVAIPKVEDGLTYLVALHEIGHVLTHNNRNGKLLREAAAWKWAIENAHIPVPVSAWEEAFNSLDVYIQQRHHAKWLGFTAVDGPRGEFRIPAKGHWFWDVYEALKTRAVL